MIKLVFCCHRRSDLSRAEFQDYWLNAHAKLVESVHEHFPQMIRYVQSHTITIHSAADNVSDDVKSARNEMAEPFDGITEIWLDTSLSRPQSDEIVAASRRLVEDEHKFIDFSRSTVFYTEEHEIFNDRSPA